jgi:hypothetical protein
LIETVKLFVEKGLVSSRKKWATKKKTQ